MSRSREPSPQPFGHEQDRPADESTAAAAEPATRQQPRPPDPADTTATATDSLSPDTWKAMLDAALPRPAPTQPPEATPESDQEPAAAQAAPPPITETELPSAPPPPADPPPAPLPVPAVRPPRRPPQRRRTGLFLGAAIALLAIGLAAGLALAHQASSPSRSNGNATAAAIPTSTAPASATTAAAPTGASGNIQVVRQGVAQLPPQPDGDQKATYAAVLRNPRSGQIAVGVQATITLTGANGSVVETKDKTINALLPGQTGAVAGDTDAAGVTGVRVQVLVTRWAPAGQDLTGGLQASATRTALVAAKLTTTATVHSALRRNLGKVKVVAVWYDRAGHPVGGSDDSLDALPAGASAPVTIDTSTVPPGVDVTRTEVYAVPDELFPTSD
jgi:hypothetical protein